jgi:hypothetical protein
MPYPWDTGREITVLYTDYLVLRKNWMKPINEMT